MNKKKYLFTGGSSFLALNWANIINDKHKVYLCKNNTDINLPNSNIIKFQITHSLKHSMDLCMKLNTTDQKEDSLI